MSGDGDAAERSICALTEDEQRTLIVELTSYASYLMRTKAFWISRSELPRGYEPGSLAVEAITRVLDGRRRDWDPEKEPNVTAYLKSVVQSIFSKELLPAAKRGLAEVASTDEGGNDRTFGVPSPDANPEEVATVDSLKESILGSFEIEEDQLVLMCLFENVTAPADIAAETGLEQGEVYRIKQKIKRRLVGLQEDD